MCVSQVAECSVAEQPRVQLRMVYDGDYFGRLVRFPVIVERWDRVTGRDGGSRRRKWLAAFTEDERHKLRGWYGLFYKWHLQTGTPREVYAAPKTVELLIRAVNFFATV